MLYYTLKAFLNFCYRTLPHLNNPLNLQILDEASAPFTLGDTDSSDSVDIDIIKLKKNL